MGNQNVQLIAAKDRTPEQKLNIVMRSGLVADGAQLSGAKKPTMEWVWKSTNKPSTFDLQKQKKTFVQAQRELCDVAASCSKTNDKGKGIVSIPL